MEIGIKTLVTIYVLVNVTVCIRNTTYSQSAGTITADEYIASISEHNLQTFAASLLQMCQFLRICNTLVISNGTDLDTCCFKCSCDDDCYKSRTCCPHIVTPQSREECLHPTVFSSDPRLVNTSGYLFITTCQSDEEGRHNCVLHTGEYGLNLTDVTPVTSASNNQNYINVDCAMCNRAEHIHTWQTEIRCIYNPFTRSLNTRTLPAPFGDCYVYMLPPAGLNISATRCYTDRISECNTTGRWEIYDPHVERMCRNVHILLILKPDRRYENIFCAICNGEDVTATDECIDEQITDNVKGFIKYLDFGLQKSQSKIQHITTEREPVVVCEVGWSYDPLTRKCKVVHCAEPLKVDLYTKRCNSVSTFSGQTNEGIILIAVRLIPNKQLDLTQVGHIQQTVYNYLPAAVRLKQFGPDSVVVVVCFMQMYFKLVRMFREENKHDVATENPNIFEVIVTCQFFYKGSTGASYIYSKLQETLSTLPNALLVLETNVRFDVVLDALDSWELLYPIDMQAFKAPNGNVVHVLKDKYSALSFMKVEAYLDLNTRFCTSFSEYKLVYKLSFISCPSFLYDLEAASLERHPGGLQNVNDYTITFGFGEFRSVNKSHVLICVDSVVPVLQMSGVRSETVYYAVFVYSAFLYYFCIF